MNYEKLKVDVQKLCLQKLNNVKRNNATNMRRRKTQTETEKFPANRIVVIHASLCSEYKCITKPKNGTITPNIILLADFLTTLCKEFTAQLRVPAITMENCPLKKKKQEKLPVEQRLSDHCLE
ncbi:hypothetical protein T07_7351 [Trichinella nelsoni]|uniref:Uncharacterized protein n=1 Tax=Trichinella nelsoni TaxID=6336 RepID=A0A0V0S1M1_9BILA|nr:hypothetical protein T07_7351 [Trichinella nelsoni]